MHFDRGNEHYVVCLVIGRYVYYTSAFRAPSLASSLAQRLVYGLRLTPLRPMTSLFGVGPNSCLDWLVCVGGWDF